MRSKKVKAKIKKNIVFCSEIHIRFTKQITAKKLKYNNQSRMLSTHHYHTHTQKKMGACTYYATNIKNVHLAGNMQFSSTPRPHYTTTGPFTHLNPEDTGINPVNDTPIVDSAASLIHSRPHSSLLSYPGQPAQQIRQRSALSTTPLQLIASLTNDD